MTTTKRDFYNFARSFNNTKEWTNKIRRWVTESKIRKSSLVTYICGLRALLIEADFNGHRGVEYESQRMTLRAKWGPIFDQKWESLGSKDKIKFLRRCHEYQEGFEADICDLDYIPEQFRELTCDKLLGKFSISEVKEQRKQARKQKFSKENLLWISEPAVFLDRVLSGLSSENPSTLFPALLLASGLRVSDIYFGATCKPVPSHPYKMLVYSNLKKGLKLSNDSKCGVIFLLCEFNVFNAALTRFRSLFPHIQNSLQASTSRGPQNKKWCLKAVGNLATNFKKCHSLRAIYAKFCYILWGREERECNFFKEMLLHDSDHISSEYETVKIPEETWSTIRPWSSEGASRSP